MGQNDNSDPYAIQEPRQAPYTNPYDIPQGYSPNDYVYKNVAPKVNSDPYATTWTDEQEKRKQLHDAQIERDNLENSFVGMPTTEVVLQLGEHDDTIQRLTQELGIPQKQDGANAAPSVPTTTEPIPEYSQPEETKPFVPTMTAPIPEYSQTEETGGNSDPYAIQEPRQAPYTNPYDIPQGNNPNDYVYKNETPKVNSDPYAIPWTDEQKARKQLQDAINARKKLEQSFVGMPTTEVVVKLGEHDDTIQRLSQELGVDDSASVPTMTAPIPEHSLPAPKVPTMMEPIPENGQPEETKTNSNSDPYAIQEPRQAPYTNPYDIPSGYNPNDYVYPTEDKPVYTNPYDIPWTEEQRRKADEPEAPSSAPEDTGRDSIYDGDGRRRRETNQPAVPSGGDNGAGVNASDDYYIKPSGYTDEDYGKELLKQLYLHNQDGTADAFLTQNGYAASDEGKMALIQEVQDRIGMKNVPEYWESLNETYGDDKHEITAPTTARPGWEGTKGEKLYLEGSHSGSSQEIFGDFNSEDTIEYLKYINENTPIAGGISEIIDWFDNGELRMITYTVEITAEDINKERVAQTESTIKGVAGFAGFLMDIASFYASGMQYTDSAGVTNDSFMDYGIENITGQVDTESICHAIADFLTPKISGNETYIREETVVYCFTPNKRKGGYDYKKMEFTLDYTPYAWHYAKVNHEEYYNNY